MTVAASLRLAAAVVIPPEYGYELSVSPLITSYGQRRRMEKTAPAN